MTKKIRIVSIFILITFLFSTFLIPANINARVNVKQEVNFGEPGEEDGWALSNLTNNVATNPGSVNSEATSGFQDTKITIWYIYCKVLFNQFCGFIL